MRPRIPGRFKCLLSRVIGKVPHSTRRRIKGSNKVPVLLHSGRVSPLGPRAAFAFSGGPATVMLHFKGPGLAMGSTIATGPRRSPPATALPPGKHSQAERRHEPDTSSNGTIGHGL